MLLTRMEADVRVADVQKSGPVRPWKLFRARDRGKPSVYPTAAAKVRDRWIATGVRAPRSPWGRV